MFVFFISPPFESVFAGLLWAFRVAFTAMLWWWRLRIRPFLSFQENEASELFQRLEVFAENHALRYSARWYLGGGLIGSSMKTYVFRFNHISKTINTPGMLVGWSSRKIAIAFWFAVQLGYLKQSYNMLQHIPLLQLNHMGFGGKRFSRHRNLKENLFGHCYSRWYFQRFFIFTPTWGK